MRLPPLTKGLPGWKNALLALLSAILLILAFPDFDYWFLAWFSLVPLMWAVEREKESTSRSFVLGWIFGTAFFFGTCWWLTYAPITYAAFPPILAYFLLFCVCLVAGLFPAMFAATLSVLLRRFGWLAFLAAPFVWVFTEFLRFWITGNNWNALAYSQAFSDQWSVDLAQIGGIYFSSLPLLTASALIVSAFVVDYRERVATIIFSFIILASIGIIPRTYSEPNVDSEYAALIYVQPNVPMSGLTAEKWDHLRFRHTVLAEEAIRNLRSNSRVSGAPITVVFPESPMNFMYDTDPETRDFIDGFAKKNNVSVLFNSAEPDAATGKFFNSAVMVGPRGGEVAQYDKIYLLPFGEAVPFPLEGLLPGFVGNFSYGNEYDLFQIGEAKAGVMICFESHFSQLSREYVRNGADAIIEMTNDGYLGPTPVLRQHLANAVFRAIETNRPVYRATNVGISAWISARGVVWGDYLPYKEEVVTQGISKSDKSQTIFVRYGDWFAWVCTLVTIVIFGLALKPRDAQARA